jgi:hypothetical protein
MVLCYAPIFTIIMDDRNKLIISILSRIDAIELKLGHKPKKDRRQYFRDYYRNNKEKIRTKLKLKLYSQFMRQEMTFDEVIDKHFTGHDTNQQCRYTHTQKYVYSQIGSGRHESVTVMLELDGGHWIWIQEFSSPEKLDQFLTLLFEE